MDTEVDLSALALDRGGAAARTTAPRLRLVTRYVLPAAILVGFAALAAWGARDLWQPPCPVTVVGVLAVRADRPREGTLLFQAAGWVQPRPTPVRVAALAPGAVKQLLVVEDQAVQEGETIATLVDEDARLAVEQAEADAKLREAELAQARAMLQAAVTRLQSPVHLEAPLAEAEAALAQVLTLSANLPFELRRAEAARELAERSYQGKSAARDSVTARVLDQARAELASAESLVAELQARKETLNEHCAALRKRCDALRKQLELKADEQQAHATTTAEVAVAEARLEQARVAVASARLQLGRMTIRSPIAGRVLQLVAQPGTMLSAGKGHTETHDGSTVVTLYRPDRLQVRVDVRFEDLLRVSIGQPVRIVSPAVPQPLSGSVLFLTSSADVQKNTLEVKAAIDSPPPVLKPEMLVQVTFLAPPQLQTTQAATEEQRLYLPAAVVRRDAEGAYVWLADRSEGVARRVAVQTGISTTDGLVEITSGVNLASRAIASGADGLTDGVRIRISGEEDLAAAGKTNSEK